MSPCMGLQDHVHGQYKKIMHRYNREKESKQHICLVTKSIVLVISANSYMILDGQLDVYTPVQL